MNTKSKFKLRNFLCSVIAIFAFALANLSFLHFSNESCNSYAVSLSRNKIEISNSNFNKDSNTTFPIQNITGFTTYSNDYETTNSNPNCGVIDLSDDDYSTRFAIAKEGRMSLDNYVLMLSSTSSAKFGYRTKNAISMNANSNYMITVDVFNETAASIANLSLYNDNVEFTKIDNILSANTWTTYHLFVKTAEDALNLKLGLNITGEGTVLFDNIACYEISDYDLEQSITSQEDLHIAYAYKNEFNSSNLVDNFTVLNNNFVGSSGNKSIVNTNSVTNKNDETFTEISTIDDFDGKNLKALHISNKQKTFVEYTAQDLFNFELGLVYKVSINVKTTNLSGSASLQLIENQPYAGTKALNSDKLTISSNTSNSVNNNYQTYSFYVVGDPTTSTNYNLAISLGSSSDYASGNLYISQIKVSKVKSSNIVSDSSNIKLELNKQYVVSLNPLYVNNGNFDTFTIENTSKPYPATPSNWTVTTGNGNQMYGVMNTKISNFNLLSGETNYPYVYETNENVLFMYNQNADSLIYKSESVDLEENKYHKIELDVQSALSNIEISIVGQTDNNEFTLISKSISTENTNWKTLAFHVRTGSQPIKAYVKINLTSSSKAYAYIDNVEYNYQGNPTEEEFNSAANKIDLRDLFNSNLFTSEENTNGKFEIVDLTSANYIDLFGEENIENFVKNTVSNNKLIKVQNTVDTDFNITSNIAFMLKSATKYKITIDAFSVGLRTEVADADPEKLGFGIKLTDFENYFTAKQSNGKWTTYTLYINPTSETKAYLDLSLGNENLVCSGTVYFANINLVELKDETDIDFSKISENDSTIILKSAEKETKDDSNSNENTNENKSSIDKQTLLYVIPTVVFALAIVITIVGVFVRKIKWKKPTRKTKNSYDRNKTVSKQYYERKATMLREEKLRELNKQLEQLNLDRTTYEEQYKLDISSLRKMKISRASNAEIAKLEKEMKKNQKTASTIGVSISKIKREIEYMQTDLYYNSLVKQLQVRGVDNEEETK